MALSWCEVGQRTATGP